MPHGAMTLAPHLCILPHMNLPQNLPLVQNEPPQNFCIKDPHLLKPPSIMGAGEWLLCVLCCIVYMCNLWCKRWECFSCLQLNIHGMYFAWHWVMKVPWIFKGEPGIQWQLFQSITEMIIFLLAYMLKNMLTQKGIYIYVNIILECATMIIIVFPIITNTSAMLACLRTC